MDADHARRWSRKNVWRLCYPQGLLNEKQHHVLSPPCSTGLGGHTWKGGTSLAEELTFARKASGLVRGLSLYDAFGMGIINTLPLYGIWFMFMSLAIFPKMNLLLAVVITTVTLGVVSPIVWGVLGASMPRSGGDYLYNTRVINPVIGMAASMGMVLGEMYWSIYMATWITQPSLQIIGQYTGWKGLTNFANSTSGTFLCSVLLFVAAFCLVSFGWRVYHVFIRPVLFITLAMTAVVFLPMIFRSPSSFIHIWNSAAAHYHSLNYHAFIKAVGKASGSPITGTWNWSDTIGGFTATFMLVIYNYVAAYVGGEVKKPGKAVFLAHLWGNAITVGLSLICLAGLYRMVSMKFMVAAAWNQLNGPIAGYKLPWDTSLLGVTFMGSGMNRVFGVLTALTWLFGTIAIFAVILVFVQRVLFAWSMDRMAPKFLSDISTRWATPVKGFALVAVIICGFSLAYILWLKSALTGLVAAGMMTVSVFLVTSISAILLPYRKRVRMIWEASPYSQWKIGRVPVVTIAGVIYCGYVLVLLYYAFLSPRTRDITGKNAFIFIGIWVFGILWYLGWRYGNRKKEINIDVAFKELPPE